MYFNGCRDEVLETIDWNDFVRPVSEAEERSDSMLDDRYKIGSVD